MNKPFTLFMATFGAYFTFTGILSLLSSADFIHPVTNLKYFVIGYNELYSHLAESYKLVEEMHEWQFQYLLVGIIIRLSVLLMVLTDIDNTYLPLSAFLHTSIRYIFAWPIFILIIFIAYFSAKSRGDFDKTDREISPNNISGLVFLKKLWEYLKITLFLSVVAFVYVGSIGAST
ncbi:hypothetical protein U0N67_004965 [Vibrio parahaemolyticus]|nr:hypothetical protein [Vibrio parahaemolyticus]ELZ7201052.1 hypothetical protein [Vibrio parahaemolyticus]MBE3821531.1 hypothetical protein [Vibrio parahaemolyticus]MBM5119536.1 hypothetical protein [Vibrio parahaemolyticus]MBM5124183.1 hypothetical protein [Vibrio parahaemolyticus]